MYAERNFVSIEFFNIIRDLKPFFRNKKYQIIILPFQRALFKASHAPLQIEFLCLFSESSPAQPPMMPIKIQCFRELKCPFRRHAERGLIGFDWWKFSFLKRVWRHELGEFFFKNNSMMLLLAVEARWTTSISPALPRRIIVLWNSLKLNYDCSFVFTNDNDNFNQEPDKKILQDGLWEIFVCVHKELVTMRTLNHS